VSDESLLEALIRRRATRQGFVFSRRETAEPPKPESPLVDELIHTVSQHFDFSPLFSGDQVQARQLATAFLEHMKLVAREINVPWDEVQARLSVMDPYWRKTFTLFQRTLRAGG